MQSATRHATIATDRTIRRATLGAAAIAGLSVPTAALRLAVFPVVPGQVVQGIAAAALISPFQVWLTVARARGRWSTIHYGGVAVLAAAHLVAFYALGIDWAAAFCYSLAGFVFFLGPFPWGIVGYLAASFVPPVLTLLFGEGQDWVLGWMIGTLEYGASLAVVVALTKSAVQLRATQTALSDQAVTQERLRIDDELRATVGGALASMIADAGRANERADPVAARADVRAIVDTSRRTLADVRRTVRRYQTASAQTEIDTTVALLRAAGITTVVTVPPTGLPPTFSVESTRRLRSGLSRLLTESPSARAMLIVRDDQVELRAESS